jgi:hypothetical protein
MQADKVGKCKLCFLHKMDQWLSLFKMVMNLRPQQNSDNFIDQLENGQLIDIFLFPMKAKNASF